MARKVYRVCRARYARYMAESVALAVLENLVHMSRQDFPTAYVCVTAVIPDGVNIMRRLISDCAQVSEI